MDDDRRKGIERAIENYHRKLAKELAGPTRKNDNPEKAVELECLAWMRFQGWSVEIYEAKAKFVNGVWRNAGMKFGTVDCLGTDKFGHSVFVEFKAPGKRSSFNLPRNYKQKMFLRDKIHCNAFGCVVDSAELLAKTYERWRVLRLDNFDLSRAYLFDCLPRPKKSPSQTEILDGL